jgi:acetylornithine deacetylase/succinyl-diaminopimelate desuccinylase-like protein
MRAVALTAFAVLLASTAQAAPPGHGPAETTIGAPQARLRQIAGEVSAARLHETIATLVGFGTRHTASDTASPTRGIGAARRWVKKQFELDSQACGGCLEVITPSESFTGKRLPEPTEVMDVVAIQRGTGDPDRVIVITGHLDSRVRDVMDAASDAPGANDDGSGTAAVIEAARVLSRYRFRATLVFAALSGEEQGLYGGQVLAHYAQRRGWRVEADLNNDIVGNTHGQGGTFDDRHVRIFSEGTKAVETPEQAERRRYNGGEVDSPSRNLARFIDQLADRYVAGLDAVMVYRTDRYGRGGDQVPMLQAGYPAVRVTEATENYTRQHQDIRVEDGVRYGDVIEGVDFAYLAKVTRLNAVTMAALASAPPPPAEVKIEGAVSPDTRVSWTPSPGAASYRVWWRPTTAPQWLRSRPAPGDASSLKLQGVVIDDFFFGVQAVSEDGYPSPVEFPGPAGAFLSAPPAEN